LISFPENSYFGPFTPKLQPERRDTEDGVQVERERERDGMCGRTSEEDWPTLWGYHELIGKPQPHLFYVT